MCANSIYSLTIKLPILAKNYLFAQRFLMTKGDDKQKTKMSIIGKRVAGTKIMYHVKTENDKKWVAYQDLIEHLDLVIEYEKNRKDQIKGLNRLSKKGKAGDAPVNIEIEQDSNQTAPVDKEPKREISDIVFSKKEKGVLQFKVKFTDESFKYMTNTDLRKHYPLKLLDFYENNVQISFK